MTRPRFIVLRAATSTVAVLFLLLLATSAYAQTGDPPVEQNALTRFVELAFEVLAGVLLVVFVVLVFIPIVLAMCERLERSPSRYLIPLSFASMFGGMITLIGTSTNVVVAEAGQRALAV